MSEYLEHMGSTSTSINHHAVLCLLILFPFLPSTYIFFIVCCCCCPFPCSMTVLCLQWKHNVQRNETSHRRETQDGRNSNFFDGHLRFYTRSNCKIRIPEYPTSLCHTQWWPIRDLPTTITIFCIIRWTSSIGIPAELLILFFFQIMTALWQNSTSSFFDSVRSWCTVIANTIPWVMHV